VRGYVHGGGGELDTVVVVVHWTEAMSCQDLCSLALSQATGMAAIAGASSSGNAVT
jgi:hypothetical protein